MAHTTTGTTAFTTKDTCVTLIEHPWNILADLVMKIDIESGDFLDGVEFKQRPFLDVGKREAAVHIHVRFYVNGGATAEMYFA